MFTELHWIQGPWPGRLAVAARPRGGEWLFDEMKSWRSAGLDGVLSLLTAEEALDLDLQNEAQSCRETGLEFFSLPIADRRVPPMDSGTIHLIDRLDNELSRGKNIVVHCRQGLGRSGLIAASLLILRGLIPSEAIERVSRARHIPIPETPEQFEWIAGFGAAAHAAGQPSRK